MKNSDGGNVHSEQLLYNNYFIKLISTNKLVWQNHGHWTIRRLKNLGVKTNVFLVLFKKQVRNNFIYAAPAWKSMFPYVMLKFGNLSHFWHFCIKNNPPWGIIYEIWNFFNYCKILDVGPVFMKFCPMGTNFIAKFWPGVGTFFYDPDSYYLWNLELVCQIFIWKLGPGAKF